MGTLRIFEIDVIRLLGAGILSDEQFSLLRDIAEPALYEYTGNSYFLTVRHPALPNMLRTLSTPSVIGNFGELQCGFVVFLGEHELTLECHSWGDMDVPAGFRDLTVSVSTLPTNK